MFVVRLTFNSAHSSYFDPEPERQLDAARPFVVGFPNAGLC